MNVILITNRSDNQMMLVKHIRSDQNLYYPHIITNTKLVKIKYVAPMEFEQSGEGIFGRRSHKAKLFERFEHSGSR